MSSWAIFVSGLVAGGFIGSGLVAISIKTALKQIRGTEAGATIAKTPNNDPRQ